MEFCNFTVINRLISSAFTRTYFIRYANAPVIACCHNKHSPSEYFSGSDSDDDSRGRGRQTFKRGYRQDNVGDNYSGRQNFDNYNRRGFDDNNRRGFEDNNRRGFDNYNNRGYDDYNKRDRGSFGGEGLRNINWEAEALSPVNKKSYIPSDIVDNRSDEEVQAFRDKHSMTVRGRDVPKPILEFSEYEFPEDVQKLLAAKGFEQPTPIQSQSWPAALMGRDLVGIGQTGSGKTLGYILPALAHIKIQHDTGQHFASQSAQPTGLVMAPTRELAQQIDGVAREAEYSRWFKTACLYGGASKGRQTQELNRKPSLCVATPGRLLDFLEMGTLNLKRCSYLVIDEADRMLDMGFEPQIRKVVSQMRPDRQTLMWSATWPKEIRSLASEFLDDFVQIKLGSTDITANSNIIQQIEVCDRFEKEDRLHEIINSELKNPDCKILIFSETKKQVDHLSYKLRDFRISAASIHGDHSQRARDNSLQGFRRGRFKVLLATNVASRGIDVNDISLVINFDFPTNIEDYVHRIGRTGRAGKSGRAISLMTEDDSDMVKDLIEVLEQTNQEVNPELRNMMSTRGSNSKKRRGGSYNKFGNRSGGNRSYYGNNRNRERNFESERW